MRTVPAQLLAGVRMLVVLTLLLGVAYPLVVLGIGRLSASNADGSLVRVDGQVVGSDLIGQAFTDPATGAALPQWFQSRPSAGGDDPTASGASNRGPEDVTDAPDRTSLLTAVCSRSAAVGSADGVSGARPYCAGGAGTPGRRGDAPDTSAVPPDAVTASASGLDPDISPAYARLQVQRVAQARGLDPGRVRALVEQHVQGRTLGFLGEPRVDVLQLNLALLRLP